MKEHGAVVKKCRGCLRVAVLYPGPYQGMVYSLAVQIIYYMLNSMPWVVAERFCAGRGCPRGVSLETGAPLRSFVIVLSSVSYELQAGRLVEALLEGGVEPRRTRRRGGPVVVAGGPAAMSSPLTLSAIVDAVAVGEAEELLPPLLEAVRGEGRRGLEALAGRGFYVPGSGARARRLWVRRLDDAFHPVVEFRVPGSGEPWGEAYMVEVSRGCSGMCSFCMESRLSCPLRHRSLRVLEGLIEEGVEANRVARVAFYSLNLLSRRDLLDLLRLVVDEMGLGVAAGSLRVEAVGAEVLELLAKGGQRVATLAPEVLVERLQGVTWKRFTIEGLERAVEECVRLGMHPKLYMMTGLPGEEWRDVVESAEKLRRLYRLSGGRLRVSLNPLIPKPWTPLQWAGLIPRKEYERRARLLSRSAPVTSLPWREAELQVVLSRGGLEAGEAVVEAVASTGRLTPGALRAALQKRGVKWRALTGPLPLDEEPPWFSVLDVGVPLASLRRAWDAVSAG